MGLFKRKPLYNDFTITAGSGGGLDLRAHFTSATKGKDAALPAKDILERLHAGTLHPADRDLFMLALEHIATRNEDHRMTTAYSDYVERCETQQRRIHNMLASDRYDLPAPDHPYRRHLLKDEPPRRYKSYTLLTGTPDNIRVALKRVKPDMYYSASSRSHHPRFTDDFTEHRLLYEHRNNGHLNYDDQVMVHEALLEMRAYKIQNDLPIIPQRAPEPAPKPPEKSRKRDYGGWIFL